VPDSSRKVPRRNHSEKCLGQQAPNSTSKKQKNAAATSENLSERPAQRQPTYSAILVASGQSIE
jgi:hypothetical protein